MPGLTTGIIAYIVKIVKIDLVKVALGGFHKKLKTLDTIGNCQRPVFSLDVSQLYNNKPVKI